MAPIKVERILSVSSEDAAYLADNLLKTGNNKKWKCKLGDKQASVILQLDQNSSIDGIDIGNENSAFVEVLVGRSSAPTTDYKVLLVTSSLMSLKESKDGINKSGVRFFKRADLNKPAVDEKWDRVKIVCTQPFNKHAPYGLSFVVLHSSVGQTEEKSQISGILGHFALKKKEEEEPAIGTWFAKRKDPPPPLPPGAAASIRDASTPRGIAQGKLSKPTPKRPKGGTPANGVVKLPTVKNVSPKPECTKVKQPVFNVTIRDDEDSPADDTDADSNYSPTKDSFQYDDNALSVNSDDSEETISPLKRPKRDLKVRNQRNGEVAKKGSTLKRKINNSGSESKSKTAKVEKETKPFSQLLKGVTIVISGYQNPLRSDLRSKACSMGARYKMDWDASCTHLICAFVNTPKFNQVRGRGKIVKKEWVTECHNRRRKLPWRRFALDRKDVGTSSEEEVWEEGSIPTTSNTNATTLITTSGVNRRKVSSGSDTEEEIERVRARQIMNKITTPDPSGVEDQVVKKTTTADRSVAVNPFADETDVDSDTASATAHLKLLPLPDIFENIVFMLASDIVGDERRKLHRYITAYKGRVVDDVDGSVEYVITKLPDIAAEVGEEYGISAMTPDWVWTCSDHQKLIPVTDFVL